jgi:hypothetical protein
VISLIPLLCYFFRTISFIALLTCLLWAFRGRNSSFFNTPPNSESLNQDSQINGGTPKANEPASKGYYDWTTYQHLPPEVKKDLEEAFLKKIIMEKYPSMTREGAMIACLRLLQDKAFHALLLECWEKGSLELLHSHGTLFCL